MVAVHCAQCGEELMGAVNRCWKCGRHFRQQLDGSGRPPISQAPLASRAAIRNVLDPQPEPLEAELTDESEQTAGGEFARHSQPKRIGSPFAGGAASTTVGPQRPAGRTSVSVTSRQRQAAAMGGAVGSVVLGVLSLLVLPLTYLASLILAGMGLAMGTWGLWSKRRGLAIGGLLLCCLVLTLSAYYGAMRLYVLNQQANQLYAEDGTPLPDY